MNGQTVTRMRSDFLLRLTPKQREEFIRWSLPWLPVDKELTVCDDDYRVRIVMEPRRRIGRPPGLRNLSRAQFLGETERWTGEFWKLHGRKPKSIELAAAMNISVSAYYDYMRNYLPEA